MISPFKLYPVEQHWWSYADYAAVLAVMRERKPARVLEFGPGSSTLALIEGGATHIDTCEDKSSWAEVYRERLQDRFPGVVTLRGYVWQVPLSVMGVDDQRYDLALIDGPHTTPRRPMVIEYCLQRCDAVLLPTEDWDGERRLPDAPLPKACAELAEKYGRTLTITETGPLSGGFALLC